MKNFSLIFSRFVLLFFICHLSFVIAADRPLYIADLPNLHEYELFANNGWNGNWYVGYDHCWIVKLPPVKDRNVYKTAFIGVRLGRAKTEKQIKAMLKLSIEDQNKKLAGATPSEKKDILDKTVALQKKQKALDGLKIYIAVSDDSDFTDDKKYIAAYNDEIPLDGDYNEALNNTGSSRWFWVEVPIKSLSKDKDNFVAVWADSLLFTSPEYAPVIASGWASKKDKYAYLSTDNAGEAPKGLEKKISFFTPALAIKLVPENNEELSVKIKKAGISKDVLRVCADVNGYPERLRLRVFKGAEEIPTGFGISAPPYCLTIYDLKQGRYRFYLEAIDYYGNKAKSKEKTFEVE